MKLEARELMIELMGLIWRTTKNPFEKLLNVILFLLRGWLFDTVYYGVSENEFEIAVQEYRRWIERNELVWTADRFDCDDFAVTFKAVAISVLRKNSVGIAIGMLYKGEELLGGHAWNIILFDDGTILFFEPQTLELFTNETIDGFRYELTAVLW